jgi:hypothetical protein
MKVNILPSILKGGGAETKGGQKRRGEGQGGGTYREGGHTGRGDIQGGGTYREGGAYSEGGHTGRGDIQGGGTYREGGAYREGGHTGRGDIQGGGTYREGGHTGRGDIQGGGTYMEGGQGGGTDRQWWMGDLCLWGLIVRGRPLFVGGVVLCPQALVIHGRGRRCLRGIVVVHGGGSSLSVGTAMPVLCRRGVVGVVWGSSRLVVHGGVVIVYGGSLWVRGGSLWSMVSVGGRRPWVGGRHCACVGSLSVHACVGGCPRSWAPDCCSGAVIEGGGRSLLWCCGVCVAVNVARPDGPSTCHVSSSVVAPFVGHHHCQHSSRSSFL